MAGFSMCKRGKAKILSLRNANNKILFIKTTVVLLILHTEKTFVLSLIVSYFLEKLIL